MLLFPAADAEILLQQIVGFVRHSPTSFADSIPKRDQVGNAATLRFRNVGLGK
jgi:hypothetical protein